MSAAKREEIARRPNQANSSLSNAATLTSGSQHHCRAPLRANHALRRAAECEIMVPSSRRAWTCHPNAKICRREPRQISGPGGHSIYCQEVSPVIRELVGRWRQGRSIKVVACQRTNHRNRDRHAYIADGDSSYSNQKRSRSKSTEYASVSVQRKCQHLEKFQISWVLASQCRPQCPDRQVWTSQQSCTTKQPGPVIEGTSSIHPLDEV